MSGIERLKCKVRDANALGRQNLTEKNVEISETATTYDIMGKIAEVSGEELLDNTVIFIVDGEPYEMVSVKNGNSVNAPTTAPAKEGLILGYWENDGQEIIFPYMPTEDCELNSVFVEWAVVRKLTTDDITYGRGFTHERIEADNNPPYTSDDTTRAGYFYQDIPIEYGYTYRFDFVSTSANAQMALVFLTQSSLDKMASSSSYGGTYYDTGWQESGFEFEVPESYNGSPVRCVRISFRMSPNNENVVNGFIRSVTISRKLAG